jgi:hypothetical protein
LAKVTVPVGVPAGEATVAVNVTAWPYSDELVDTVSAVVVAARFTVCIRMPVLGATFASPA